MKEPENFKELVTWATWTVIQDITKGKPLESTMHTIIDYVLRWKEQNAKN